MFSSYYAAVVGHMRASMALDSGPTPLYYQIKTILEGKIRSQELKARERLPSEAELCAEFGVSRVTVRQALSVLFKDGLIYRERGKGTYISEGAGWTRPVLQGSIESLMSAGIGTRIKILSYRGVVAPKELSKNASLQKSETVYRLELVRFVPSGPQAYSLLYFPADIGKLISKDEITETTELISFVEDKVGTKAQGAHQTIDVGVANELLAKNLDVKEGTPLLVISREYFTRTGTLLFFAKTYYRTDRFRYQIELARTSTTR
jgi:GntR family transcriptional regulator